MNKIIILIIACISLFSDAKIGIPYMERGEGHVESMITSPTSESFYTLNNGVVVKWQISPPKKMHSFNVDIDKDKSYTIYVTPDDKKLLLHSKDDISIWDIKSGSLIKQVENKSIPYKKRNVKVAVGIVAGYTFYSLGEDFILKKWNMQTLKLIETHDLKQIRFKRAPWEEEGNCLIHEKPVYLLPTKHTLLYFTANIIYVLDKETYKVLRKIYHTQLNWHLSLSLDSKYLYYARVKSTIPLNMQRYSKYDLDKNIEISMEYDEWAKAIKGKTRFNEKTYRLINYKKQITENSIEVVWDVTRGTQVSKSDRLYHLHKKSNGKDIASFYIYNNKIMLLVKRDGTFQASENARKYLKMKLPSGKILPINEQTYKKFNQTINLKD